jgi:LPS sulfotransferase NodH
MRALRFFRAAYDDNARRLPPQRRALAPDIVGYARNLLLRPRERRLVARHHRPGVPLCFIVGVPRSGTTLLHQLMARHLDVGYVSNFVARYWMAPVWGSIAWRRRFPGAAAPPVADSRFGVVAGPHAPHEFSWFWRYWAPFEASDHPTDGERRAVDWNGPRRELEALAGWWERPLLLKNLNHADYNVSWFAEIFPGSRFVWIERDPVRCAESILRVREERYGNESSWWSVRPRECRRWERWPAEDQVAAQIRDILAHLERSWGAYRERHARLAYEDLVRDPRSALESLSRFLDVPLRHEAELAGLVLAPGTAAPGPSRRQARLAALLHPGRAGQVV